eukprot:1993339-Rhodomonas_salina.1
MRESGREGDRRQRAGGERTGLGIGWSRRRWRVTETRAVCTHREKLHCTRPRPRPRPRHMHTV